MKVDWKARHAATVDFLRTLTARGVLEIRILVSDVSIVGHTDVLHLQVPRDEDGDILIDDINAEVHGLVCGWGGDRKYSWNQLSA